MHDLKSLSVAEAINRHRGEARGTVETFHEDLSPAERQQLLTFLNSL